jgi:DNA repair exonuclease SbcCD nuclease subunit
MCALTVKYIVDAIVDNKVDNVIFCGDFFHQRNALTVDTLNIAHRCLKAIASKATLWMILGNHDLFNKNSVDVNSINIFNDNSKVKVISQTTELKLNGKPILMIPWLGDISSLKKESYDFVFGHFDVSSKFVVDNYIDSNSTKAKASPAASNELERAFDEDGGSHINVEADETVTNFVDLAVPHGTVFAGHIHQHKEMMIKGRKFIFIGSPCQQTTADLGCVTGFYVIKKDGSFTFEKIDDVPKHVKIRCSDIINIGIDNFDFSVAAKNIVQKVYDVDVSMTDDLEINKRIASAGPYEELLPDYQVSLDMNSSLQDEDDIVKTLKKSKLDYIQSYIDRLDKKTLKSEGIEKIKLFTVLKKYYSQVEKD